MIPTALEMVRGDTKTFTTAVTLSNLPVDITGWSAAFNASCLLPAPLSLTLSTTGGQVALTDPTHGKATLTISPTTTSSFPNQTLVFKFQWVFTDTSGNIFTTEWGHLTIYPNV
jgi:hypothetical protein